MFGKIVKPIVLVATWVAVGLYLPVRGARAARNRFNAANTPRKPTWAWLTALALTVSAVVITVCAWCDPHKCSEMCLETFKGLAAGSLYAVAATTNQILKKKLPTERVDVNEIWLGSVRDGFVGGYLLGLLLVAFKLMGL